ncbi:biopolymer transporter ExbD [Candidatus Babeliales bacterium]|nr:biopolymer transporter ExbD [Candidatus Babeliales bacterium]MBP9844323.1 biopolymer transporter ExbD [Candidatus Babeliales bacterium]
MRYNRFRRQRKPITMPEVSLTPLIDTALTLLVIFMITTPMMNNVIKVELPSSQVDEMDKHVQQETIVYIDKHQKVYLDGVEMNVQAIIKALQKMGQQKKIEMVFVKADQAVEYGKVIDLVDTIKMAGGIKYVALATKRAV